MGYDRTFTEYHLTLRGWIAGACTEDNPPTEFPPPPEDRIETWMESEVSHDVYPGITRSWELLWVSPDYSEDQRKQIRAEARDQVITDSSGIKRVFWNFPS
jgi:hypothetical protein